jgi:hypothetical protein
MAFKSGMHQLTAIPLDFNIIVSKMGHVQPKFTLPTYGWGKKCYIQAQATHEAQKAKIVIEFFSEAIFNPVPKDPKIGYTDADAVIFKRVSILNVDPEPISDGSEYHQSTGEIIPYEDFVEEYITDVQARIQLDRAMDNMEQHTIVNEKMLENINLAWENRSPGDNELYEIKYN